MELAEKIEGYGFECEAGTLVSHNVGAHLVVME